MPYNINMRKPEVIEQASHLLSTNPRLNRRTFLAVLGLGAVALACQSRSQETQPKPTSTKQKEGFSGERNETRRLLDQWAFEANNSPDKVIEYLPKIANLAIAYFSQEMSRMFPDRKEQYDPLAYKGKVNFLDKDSFFKAAGECNIQIYLGFVNFEGDTLININKERPGVNTRVEVFFPEILHGLFRFAPPRKEYPQGKQIIGIPEPIHYEKGIVAYAKRPVKNCGALYRREVDEAVARHATIELMSRLGYAAVGSSYDTSVIYQDNILTPLYGGDFRELLGYHQQTQPDKFFQSVGGRRFGESLPPEVKEQFGDQYLHDLFVRQ